MTYTESQGCDEPLINLVRASVYPYGKAVKAMYHHGGTALLKSVAVEEEEG